MIKVHTFVGIKMGNGRWPMVDGRRLSWMLACVMSVASGCNTARVNEAERTHLRYVREQVMDLRIHELAAEGHMDEIGPTVRGMGVQTDVSALAAFLASPKEHFKAMGKDGGWLAAIGAVGKLIYDNRDLICGSKENNK